MMMKIKGVYDFTVSGIDGNGQQYMTGMLESERLDNHGLRYGKAFRIGIDHVKQKTTILSFYWIFGVPQNFKNVVTLKNEIIAECEVEKLLKKYKLLGNAE